MISPVKSRPTHYDNLGLTPAATPDEIAEAFAKRIHISITSPEEAVEHAERIYIAYETLRDPISRSAYDAAIGLWDQQAAAEREVKPFIGAGARESPEHELYVASPGHTPNPTKRGRRQARRATKAAIEWPVPKAKTIGEPAVTQVAGSDRGTAGGPLGPTKKARRQARHGNRPTIGREAHAALEQTSTAKTPAIEPIAQKLRSDAHHGTNQARPGPASHRPAINRNSVGARAGVMIVAFGVLIMAVGLVRGNHDQTHTAPPQPIAIDGQTSSPSTEKATAAGEETLAADDAQSEASSIGSVAGSGRQVSKGPHVATDTRSLVDLLAGTPLGQADDPTGGQFEQNAIGKAAVTPSRQSVTGQPAGTPPPQLQVANRQPARTAPQSVPYRRTSSAARGQPSTQEDASREVSSSATEEKICMHLPLTGTRLPQQVCLTKKEWKQAEEEQRSARTPPPPVPYRQTSFTARGKPSTQEGASREVSSSATEKICTHLPLTGTRLPQQVCLTSNEWKQVEQAQR